MGWRTQVRGSSGPPLSALGTVHRVTEMCMYDLCRGPSAVPIYTALKAEPSVYGSISVTH